MPSVEFWVERLLPCACLALTNHPWPDCPECGGSGQAYREIAVEVEYAYQRASRGSRDRYGVPLEPDEPESVEIQAVTDENGREVELTANEEDNAEQRCFDDMEQRRESALEDRAEAATERERENAYFNNL